VLRYLLHAEVFNEQACDEEGVASWTDCSGPNGLQLDMTYSHGVAFFM
jgi:hypothetical protein